MFPLQQLHASQASQNAFAVAAVTAAAVAAVAVAAAAAVGPREEGLRGAAVSAAL